VQKCKVDFQDAEETKRMGKYQKARISFNVLLLATVKKMARLG